MRSRLEKLRAMAEHPTSNPHEAEIARREIERLGLAYPKIVNDMTPWTARVWISGGWLFIFAERYEAAKEIVFDVMATVGRIGGCIAIYTDDEEHRDEVANALRYNGFTVTVERPAQLDACPRPTVDAGEG